MVIGFGGAVVVWLMTWWWPSKPKALIIVARFVAVPEGDEAARKDAALLREEVVAALHGAQGSRAAFRVNDLPHAIDVALDDDVQVARRQAHERRAAVVVCGKVTVAASGERFPQIVAITSPDQSGLPTQTAPSDQCQPQGSGDQVPQAFGWSWFEGLEMTSSLPIPPTLTLVPPARISSPRDTASK